MPKAVRTMLKNPVSGSISHKNTMDTDTMEITWGVKIQASTILFSFFCLELFSHTAMMIAKTIVSPTNSTV